MIGTLVKRADKVAFYGVESDGIVTYHRMKGFTDMSVNKNPQEYSRKYVDEAFEQTDITGYSPSISFSFDQYSGNAVHDDIADIAANEVTGSDAVRSIILVDMTKKGTADKTYVASKRDFSVIAESEGGSSDAYTYSGSFKVNSTITLGTATSSDKFETITFN